jgi:acyl-CoA oxidase
VKGVDEGVNSFIVRIRDDNMKVCEGVDIQDMGMKMGLNGVDNGKLKFTNVRIDKANMLNRICDVDDDGNFVSEVKKKNARFFKVADRLLSGRLCIASMIVAASKAGLILTIKYSQ